MNKLVRVVGSSNRENWYNECIGLELVVFQPPGTTIIRYGLFLYLDFNDVKELKPEEQTMLTPFPSLVIGLS